KRAYCLKTQPATGETYPKSDLFNKAYPVVNFLSLLIVSPCGTSPCEPKNRANLMSRPNGAFSSHTRSNLNSPIVAGM
ncbi:hypothetical protein, partial [Klebsiella variicola]